MPSTLSYNNKKKIPMLDSQITNDRWSVTFASFLYLATNVLVFLMYTSVYCFSVFLGALADAIKNVKLHH